MPQLLALCPFCDHASPRFMRLGTPRQSCIVECGNCGARLESSDEDEACGSSWNARPQVDRLTATGEQLAQRLAELQSQLAHAQLQVAGATAARDEAEAARQRATFVAANLLHTAHDVARLVIRARRYVEAAPILARDAADAGECLGLIDHIENVVAPMLAEAVALAPRR